MVKPIPDLINDEHDEEEGKKKIVLFGKTTDSSYVPLGVDTDGTVLTNADKKYLKLNSYNGPLRTYFGQHWDLSSSPQTHTNTGGGVITVSDINTPSSLPVDDTSDFPESGFCSLYYFGDFYYGSKDATHFKDIRWIKWQGLYFRSIIDNISVQLIGFGLASPSDNAKDPYQTAMLFNTNAGPFKVFANGRMEVPFSTLYGMTRIESKNDLTIASYYGGDILFPNRTKIGGDTNYAQFATDGELTLHGTARVIRDLWIDASGIKAPGAKPATEISHGELETSAWSFSNEGVGANQQTVSWRVAPPYDMDRSEEVKIRIGWSSASTGNVKWQLEYRWLSEDEDTTQGAEETLTSVDAASSTSNGLIITDITGIDAPSSNDASIIFRLKRLSADEQDTITDSVELHGVCFNYTSNKLGEAT